MRAVVRANADAERHGRVLGIRLADVGPNAEATSRLPNWRPSTDYARRKRRQRNRTGCALQVQDPRARCKSLQSGTRTTEMGRRGIRRNSTVALTAECRQPALRARLRQNTRVERSAPAPPGSAGALGKMSAGRRRVRLDCWLRAQRLALGERQFDVSKPTNRARMRETRSPVGLGPSSSTARKIWRASSSIERFRLAARMCRDRLSVASRSRMVRMALDCPAVP